MHSLCRNEEIPCELCGAQTTKPNFARNKKSRSALTLFCTQCPNFSRKSHNDFKNHIAKKHSGSKPVFTSKCKLC